MRLLDTVTAKFVEKDPSDWRTKYAILSHAWDSKGEQTYQEVRGIQERYATRNRLPQGQPHDSDTPRARLNKCPIDIPSHCPSPPLPSRKASPILRRNAPVSDPSPHIPTADSPFCPIWDDPELSPKIREACAFARANGYRYIWIDSCCIDKTSSTELSEAINSMYKWYSCAEVCYAFLADVVADEDPQEVGSTFRRSRWFTRGWTLQELIAPAHVEFLAMDWTSVGSKRCLGTLVADITNINYTALLRLEPLHEFSVAQRLSWASRRKTTRVEDRAYSLLGFFGINMPTLYGEGERAFRRLQEEIMRRIPDQSLFAWSWNDAYLSLHSLRLQAEQGPDPLPCNPSRGGHLYEGADLSLLAPALDLFADCGRIEAVPHDDIVRQLQCDPDASIPASYYDFTPHGIRTQLPMIPVSCYFLSGATEDGPLYRWYLVVLGCEHSDLPGHLLGRVCYIPASGSNVQFLYCGQVTVPAQPPARPVTHYFDLLPLSLTTIADIPPLRVNFKTVHIPYSDRIEEPRMGTFLKLHERICLILPKKTRRALYAQGYIATLRGADKDHPTTQWLTLVARDESHTTIIEYQHTLDKASMGLCIEAHVRVAEAGGRRELLQEHVDTVSWTDSYPWALALDKRVVVATMGTQTLRIVLDLHLAPPDHYVPHVEISDESRP